MFDDLPATNPHKNKKKPRAIALAAAIQKEPKIVHIEQPRYPPEAKRANVEGVVILEATVTAEGAVDKVKVSSGPPMLIESAVEAVSHWKYEPTYLNGQAVPVILTARTNFSLARNP